ncbi:dimethyl sulfoxide reductase anchor subunit [Stakelama sediminis]|uniref:DMSO reductase anchor subunit n=1 Tax=Stakelama sediminis TaxID=463200 RepID=A0A840YYH7_9SPHN|nr:DmsC/YnfH family molybdoenzyme membrane anchor subunit [Stakelama sediminis]MBB5718566.1 DMSO reductase anchor subunit [Stakelama sediminis]
MRPAFSVIFFTTASGAGYGLLFWLGLAALAGILPGGFWFGFVTMALAVGLISAGLLSSTAHLGRPERAWRAFSQWRSSWLSREGVASVLTYLPIAAFGVGWVFLGRTGGWVVAAGALMALGAVVTVCMTAMIYASLKPVREWHNPTTLPGYLLFAAMTGAVLLNGVLHLFGHGSQPMVLLALGTTILGWIMKRTIWRYNATHRDGPTLGDATGLGNAGKVRSSQWPHTEQNYLLKEMGYKIARKHSARLRIIAQALAFAAPIALLAVALIAPGWLSVVGCVLAALVQLAGMLVERWLFFAEATHTVTLYYGYADKEAAA